MEYYKSASTTGDVSDLVEVQSAYSLPSSQQLFWEQARFGDSEEDVRQTFSTIVHEARRELHPDQLEEFDFVLPIMEWRTLGGLRTELPKGLVYERHDLSPNNWHTAYANDAVEWMFKATERRLNKFGLATLDTTLWSRVNSAEGTHSAIEPLVIASPLYQAFEACGTNEMTADDQPLSEYWKMVKTSAYRSQVAHRWGVAEGDLKASVGATFNAVKDLGRNVLRLDDERMPDRAPQTDNSELAFARAFRMLIDICDIPTRRRGHAVDFEPKDDIFMTVRFENGTEADYGYSWLLSRIEAQAGIVTVSSQMRNASSGAAAKMMQAVMRHAHGERTDDYEKLLQEWRTEVVDSLSYDFAKDYDDMILAAADGSLPNGVLRTVSYDAMQSGQAREVLGYVSNGENQDVHGQAIFEQLLPSSIPRMYTKSHPIKKLCTDERESDLRLRSSYKGTAVSGYKAVGVDLDGYTVFRPEGHDAYGEIPRDEGWFDTYDLARWYRKHGLTEIANKVSEYQTLHVMDLESILYEQSRYIETVSDEDARRATALLDKNKFGTLVDHEGYFITQCGGAAKLLKLSLDTVGLDAEIVLGHPIAEGAIGTIGHAQVMVKLGGLPYMLDSTPRAKQGRETEQQSFVAGVEASLPAVSLRERENLTPKEHIRKNIQSLYKSLQALYAVGDKDALIERLALTPVGQRESDAIWRSVSLMAQIEREDSVDPAALRQEHNYATLVAESDEASLQKAGVHMHDARRLGAVKQTLEAIIAIVDATQKS